MESSHFTGNSYNNKDNKNGCIVGIERIAGAASLDPISTLVKQYHETWEVLSTTQLKPKDKIQKIQELLTVLGHLHAAGMSYNIDFHLDILNETNKFFHWSQAHLTEDDKKLLSFPERIFDDNSPQSQIAAQILNAALQASVTPNLLVNVADVLYANTVSNKLNPDPTGIKRIDTLSKKKFSTSNPKLAEKIVQLENLIEQVNLENIKISRSKLKQGINSRLPIHSYAQSHSVPNSPDLSSRPVSTNSNSLPNSTVNSPESDRKNDDQNKPDTRKLDESKLSKLASFYNSAGSTLFTKQVPTCLHDYDEIDPKNLEVFALYQKIIQLAFSILNDPEFISLEKKKLKQKLLQIIVDCMSLSNTMLDKSPAIQEALLKEKNCTALADYIHQKITFNHLSHNYLGESDPILETKHIVTCLELHRVDSQSGEVYENDKITLKPLGHGNDRVYLITDKETMNSVILRGRNVSGQEMRQSRAPDQMRFRVTGALGVGGCATRIYKFIPGAGINLGTDTLYRNYEVSEAMEAPKDRPYVSLAEKFAKLHKEFNEDKITLETLQLTILEDCLKVIKLISTLKQAGICWPDLKPSNILINADGEFILSDIKTWVDTKSLQSEDSNSLTYRTLEPLQLTPGYLTIKASRKEKDVAGTVYDLDRVMNETIAFTLYQLITGNTNLWNGTIYGIQDPKVNLEKNFKPQLDQLASMVKLLSQGPVGSGNLGKSIHTIALYVYGLVNSDGASLELKPEIMKEIEEQIQACKERRKDNNATPGKTV